MKESKVRTEIVKALKVYMRIHVYHATVYGELAHSDLYGTYRGRPLYMEVKPPGWRPRNTKEAIRHAQQRAWLDDEARHGAYVAVVHSPEDALAVLKRVDNDIANGIAKG